MMKLFFLFVLFVPFLCFNQLNQTDAKGKKQGAWQKKYPDGKNVLYKGQFVDDQAVGVFTYYYQSGKIQSLIEHIPNSNQRAYVTVYFEDGAVLSKGMFKNQLKDSIWTNYTSYGALSSSENYKLNKLNGEKIILYTSGQLENNKYIPFSITNYVDDLENGLYSEFFSTGKLKTKGSYNKGLKEGEWIVYHPNGQLEKKVNYVNGLENSWVYVYDKNGVKLYEAFYQNGTILRGKELELFLKKSSNKGASD